MKIRDILSWFSWARISAARVGKAREPQRFPGGQLFAPPTPQAEGRPTPDPSGDGSLPVDPDFPRFEAATDPELMREVFQEYLRSLGGKTYEVLECRIFQTRHQRAHRVVQYILRLAEPDTGREHTQWVTGTMHAGGGTRRAWRELRRAEPGLEIPADASSAFAPFFYISDLDMLVQVFPYDRQLPALPLLTSGPSSELEPLLLAEFGLGDWRTEAWDAEPVRYLAEMRATLRLTVRARDAATGRAQEKRFYAKVYHDEEKGEQTYEVLRTLWDRASAGGKGFSVGRPIAYLSGLRTVIQEEVTGITLQGVLLREDDVIPVVRKVARDLATLHLGRTITSRRRPLQREVAIIEKAGKLLPLACPHLKTEIEETVGAVVAGLEEVPPAPTHCDLTPAHILLDEDRLVLIDLDEFAGADPMLDVARFVVPLSTAPIRIPLSRERGQAAARAFVEEYFTHAPEAWRARLPLHYAIAVLKMAGGFFRRQSPGFPDKIETLVGEARDTLDGKVW